MNKELHNRKHRRDEAIFVYLMLAIFVLFMLAGCNNSVPTNEPGHYKACKAAGGEWKAVGNGNGCVGYQKKV